MNILFVHHNYPGRIARSCPACRPGRSSDRVPDPAQGCAKGQGPHIGVYKPADEPKPDSWIYSKWLETTVGNGVGAAQACNSLKKGFTPDIITGHANWGELIYTKDIWPDTPLVGFFEYYFIPKGGLVGFDPEFPEKADIAPRLHTNNAPNYLTYVRCDGALTATHWQKSGSRRSSRIRSKSPTRASVPTGSFPIIRTRDRSRSATRSFAAARKSSPTSPAISSRRAASTPCCVPCPACRSCGPCMHRRHRRR